MKVGDGAGSPNCSFSGGCFHDSLYCPDAHRVPDLAATTPGLEALGAVSEGRVSVRGRDRSALVLTDPDGVRAALARRGKSDVLDQLARAIEVEGDMRTLQARRDTLRAEVNELSKQVGQKRRDGDAGGAEALQAQSRALGEQEAALSGEADALQAELRELLLRIPNLPHPEAPDGKDDHDNPIVKGPFLPASFPEHQRVPHWETATALGILDNERATKISGAMFTMQRGPGATLSRALCQYALDMNSDAFEEIRPPSLVTTATLTATGQLPKFEEDLFAVNKGGQEGEGEPLYLIPTSEVTLTNLVRDTVLAASELPIRLTAHTPCFRSEAGSAGRDTRGMIRQHQFDKVEMVQIVHPDKSYEALEQMTGHAEAVLQKLGLPYRVMSLCTGDMGFGAAKTYDLESHAPGTGSWLEVSSCSCFTDFQARRARVKYRPEPHLKSEFVHTLNGSGLAVGRTLVAILENYQQRDGSVIIPKALRPYVRNIDKITDRDQVFSN